LTTGNCSALEETNRKTGGPGEADLEGTPPPLSEKDRAILELVKSAKTSEALRVMARDITTFALWGSRVRLRVYQEAVALAVVESVRLNHGKTFVIMFPRQSGKNELQAQIETYLLTVLMQLDAEMVKVSPTWKPQTQNAMRRLERVLSRNLLTRDRWTKESGYIYRVGRARIFFLSGGPQANVVGATASTLLECDEAQDVTIEKWDKDFAPMAASTNATRVFWGTAWTSRTLLARELRAARQAERQDGQRRVFVLTADQVRQEVKAYGKFVDGQVARLGRNHPLIKTQFFSEEIDAEGGMFPPERQALMQGGHPRQLEPSPGKMYALLLDVAGEDEGAVGLDGGEEKLHSPKRDLTALTIVEVDTSTIADPLIQAPVYRVVNRHQWTGVKHYALYAQILALAEHWRARYVVVDATGVGAGISSFLVRALGSRVIPFTFNVATKSKLGFDFLAICDTGRFKDHVDESPERALFWQQLDDVLYEAKEGRILKWAVPDGTRTATGDLVHDDLVLSAALCAVLDKQPWGTAESAVVPAPNLFEKMEY
jgi:hypothetical protein